MRETLLHLSNRNRIFVLSEKTQVPLTDTLRVQKVMAYLDQEEVHPEGWQSSRQLDILVFRVDLRGTHQSLVVAKDFLLHILHFHEPKWEKLFQAGDDYNKDGFSSFSPLQISAEQFLFSEKETKHLRLSSLRMILSLSTFARPTVEKKFLVRGKQLANLSSAYLPPLPRS